MSCIQVLMEVLLRRWLQWAFADMMSSMHDNFSWRLHIVMDSWFWVASDSSDGAAAPKRESWPCGVDQEFNYKNTWVQKCKTVLKRCPEVTNMANWPWGIRDSENMFCQIKHVRFFEKMSFSQPRGASEKVGGHIYCYFSPPHYFSCKLAKNAF